jgi:glycosyltransferase involved in cell wall biosynthesis
MPAIAFVINYMKIAYNSQIFRMQEYGGISRYVVNLARRVAREEQVVVSAPLYINNYLAELPRDLVKGMRLPWRPRKGARLIDWVGSTIDRMIISSVSPDVLHETYYSYSSVGSASVPKVLTIYDMIHERFANWFAPDDETARRKAAAVSRASHVICISENTRRDLIDSCRVDPDKVSVVYLGYEVLGYEAPEPGADSGGVASTMQKPEPYILYVGDRVGYKNFKALLHA